MERLSTKVAVVTGAATGLGRACALALANAGATVVANQAPAATTSTVDPGPGGTVRTIRERGGRALSSVHGVSDLASIRRVVAETLGAFGRLDIWVNTLALDPGRPLLEWSDAECERQVGSDLRSVMLCTREALRTMRDRATGGRIVQVGTAPAQGGAGAPAVAAPAACGALVDFVGTAAAEAGSFGVTCNAVLPLVRPRGASDPAPGGETAAAAEVVVFLASDAGADVTGETFHIGGDQIAVHRPGVGPSVKSRHGRWTVDELAQRMGEVRATGAPAP